MFGWLMGTGQNKHSREVKVISSRHAVKTFTVYGDREVDAIDALRYVSRQIPPAEPGETIELKTYL